MKIAKIKLESKNILLVDGIPQSIYPPSEGGYWQHMVPLEKIDSALVLGVAGGTICRLLLEKNSDIQITAVDNSKEVIDYAKKYFELDKIKMKLFIDDAFEFVKKTPERYDYIAVDTWNGQYFPFSVLMEPFMSHVKRLLNENGQLYINTPNLDYLAMEQLKNGLRDDIGRNIIYRWERIDKSLKKE